MNVVYMAHPVSPLPGETLEGNLARAKRWLLWLLRNAKRERIAYIAPWIVDCEILDDADPDVRGFALERDCALIARCDAIVLVGGRLSSGMARERDAALAAGRTVVNLLSMGSEPPR